MTSVPVVDDGFAAIVAKDDVRINLTMGAGQNFD
jgi:hypothetical protein